ncbi:MAG: site-2 protease family protein [Clostridia bacterium]|nr:site-2 protease family protein [Clostridia bacterium]
MSSSKHGKKSGERRFSLFRGKLSVHPLFLAVGAIECFLGELPLFLISTVTALIHELAHAYAAERVGLSLKKIVLMPFGAMIDTDMRGLNAKDELFVALAGPACNLLCAAFFLGLWWCFPQTYAYTDTAQFSSLSIGLINLLPAYPLDGGRILRLWLIRAFNAHLPPSKSEKRAETITIIVSIFVCLGLFTLFVFCLVNGTFSLSLLLFALFVLLGMPKRKAGEGIYEKIDFNARGRLKEGLPIRRVAIDGECTLKKAIGFLSQGEYLVLEVLNEEGQPLGELPQNELSKQLLTHSLYEEVQNLLKSPEILQNGK